MSIQNIIRAWKDDQYRLSLSDEELALLPSDPAGSIELTDELLGQVAGGLVDVSVENSCVASCVNSTCVACIVNSFIGQC